MGKRVNKNGGNFAEILSKNDKSEAKYKELSYFAHALALRIIKEIFL